MPKLDLLKQVNERTPTTDMGAVSVTIKDIPLGNILINENIRDKNDVEIKELATSINQVGLLQPITVYRNPEQESENDYICLFGHRRFLAYRMLYKTNTDKYHSIRCIISDSKDDLLKKLIENIQRENLSHSEIEKALIMIMENEKLTKTQLAKYVGKSKQWINFMLQSNNIRTEIKQDLSNMESTAGGTYNNSGKKHPEKDKSTAGGTHAKQSLTKLMTDIDNIPSTVLSEFAGIKNKQARQNAITETIQKGGTRKAARMVAKKFKDYQDKQAATKEQKLKQQKSNRNMDIEKSIEKQLKEYFKRLSGTDRNQCRNYFVALIYKLLNSKKES